MSAPVNSDAILDAIQELYCHAATNASHRMKDFATNMVSGMPFPMR